MRFVSPADDLSGRVRLIGNFDADPAVVDIRVASIVKLHLDAQIARQILHANKLRAIRGSYNLRCRFAVEGHVCLSMVLVNQAIQTAGFPGTENIVAFLEIESRAGANFRA